MSSADIQKSATGITFSTTSLLLTLFCFEAAVMEMAQLPKFDLVNLKQKLTVFDNFWYN